MADGPSTPRSLSAPVSFLVVALAASVASAQPVAVQDDLGRTLHFDAPPQRIVSLSPAVTEILFALGLDAAIVAVSDFCNFPETALSKPRVGGISPNIEAIVALRPDLVISTGGLGIRETAHRLETFGIRTMGVESDSVEAVLARIGLLGTVTARHEQADALVQRLRERLALVAGGSAARRPRVLYLIDQDPYLTVGPKSFVYDLLVKAGGRPLETGPNESYPRVGLEAIVRFDPEAIFLTGETDHVPADRMAAWRRWDRITAVRTGRLYAVPRDLVNRPGPRIVDAVEYFASKLRPIAENASAGAP